MRVALVAPPFIPVPPKLYGGTELFIAQLAEGLHKFDIDVVVYCNGESTVAANKRHLYRQSQWPLAGEVYANLKDMNHSAWAVRDAVESCDLIHLNNLPGLVHSRFVRAQFVYTIHHPHDAGLSDFYAWYPEVNYVTISDFQRHREALPKIRTIHHGIDLSHYAVQENKRGYLSFLGRIAPIKGTHIAIDIARKSGIPLKIAGEVQPVFKDYFESRIRPHLDGKFIEYVGEANLEAKNELLGNSIAMLFPIQWDEPFGLVMLEAMACGTPVLAFPGGAVEEVICDPACGAVCRTPADMVRQARTAAQDFSPRAVREYVAHNFSLEGMVSKYASLYRELVLRKAGPMVQAMDQPRAAA